MKTLFIIIGIIIAIPLILLLVYIAIFAGLGRKIYNTHDENIKQAIGFDFGDKFELLYSRMRDGMLQVLLFHDDDTWKRLMEHCQSMAAGESLVTMEDGVYRVKVNKEQEEYEYPLGRDKGLNGMYQIDFTITKELNDTTAHPIITIRIDYSNRLVFYDYDSGI